MTDLTVNLQDPDQFSARLHHLLLTEGARSAGVRSLMRLARQTPGGELDLLFEAKLREWRRFERESRKPTLWNLPIRLAESLWDHIQFTPPRDVVMTLVYVVLVLAGMEGAKLAFRGQPSSSEREAGLDRDLARSSRYSRPPLDLAAIDALRRDGDEPAPPVEFAATATAEDILLNDPATRDLRRQMESHLRKSLREMQRGALARTLQSLVIEELEKSLKEEQDSDSTNEPKTEANRTSSPDAPRRETPEPAEAENPKVKTGEPIDDGHRKGGAASADEERAVRQALLDALRSEGFRRTVLRALSQPLENREEKSPAPPSTSPAVTGVGP